MLKFDYDKLYVNLMNACRKSFLDLQEQYHHETFYVLGLFSTLDYDRLYITGNTETGLTQRADYYVQQNDKNQNSLYLGYSLSEIRFMLRDVPTDWAHHCPAPYEPLFETINQQCSLRRQEIKELQQDYRKRMNNPRQLTQVIKPLNDQLVAVCLSVLHDLDVEGVFSVHHPRAQVRINFYVGNQSENERREFARELNPPEVVEAYVNELNTRDALYADMGMRREQAIKRSVAEALRKQREDLANWEKRFGQRKN